MVSYASFAPTSPHTNQHLDRCKSSHVSFPAFHTHRYFGHNLSSRLAVPFVCIYSCKITLQADIQSFLTMPPSCTKPCINEYSLERNGGVAITPPPIGKRSIVMSVSVCLSVCLSVREHVFGTTPPIFTKFFVPVTHGGDSVLLWRRSGTILTSGFIWMTSHLLISRGCSMLHG